MINKSDIRIKILEKLSEEKNSTGEFKAKDFLVTLHSDLGTIKRALIDLIEDGLIKESNVKWPEERDEKSSIHKIVTKGSPERKDSRRLINDKTIGTIRIYITLKGQQFLLQSENLRRQSWSIKNDWWIKLLYMIIGASISVLVFYATH
tara:strand:+ start:409 stop:855 length:447 start_codon:yes stop_codon:yes gene_type:complete